jgi:hypothetical protein
VISPALSKRTLLAGSKSGDERDIAGIKFCWCGQFIMGSPPDEPERSPGENKDS